MKTLKSVVAVVSLSSVLYLSGCGTSGGSSSSTQVSTNTLTIDTSTALTNEQKYALAYMWNEERLAYDLYLNLYAINNVAQLRNIALNSESVHINLIKNLVEAYDINITNLVDYTEHYSLAELEAMPSGTYGIQAIQDLYDTLYMEGIAFNQASLEVGCKVEVTDVNDLNKYIIQSAGNQALTDTFTILRDGSYQHYWAFDAGLKSLGVSDGCCSLGQTYCKTTAEY